MIEHEIWSKIPDAPERYEISNNGNIRVLYKYKGSIISPHYKLLKSDKNNIELAGKKYNIPRLMNICFNKPFCNILDGETWVDVKGYEDLYQVSNMGRIKSKSTYVTTKTGKKYFNHERIIKTCIINSGYERVVMHKGKITKSVLVHRLVAEHFLPNKYNFEQINHKNENKTDNRAINLEWCSRVYNNSYGTCQQRRIQTRLKNNNGKYGVPRKYTGSAGVEK